MLSNLVPWICRVLCAVLFGWVTHAHAQNTPTTPPTPPAGYCAVDVTLADTLPSNFILPAPVANQVTLFHSTNMTVTLVCAGDIINQRNSPIVNIGVGSMVSPLQGNLTGISANVTNASLGTVTCTLGVSSGIAIDFLSVDSVNMSLGTTRLLGRIYPGNVCTVAITATLNYYANGAAFNNTASSTNLLTDPNPGTTFKYRSFVREGKALLATPLGFNGPSDKPFSSLASKGITPFTITVQTPKTCVVSNASNKLLTFALPTLDAKTASLKNNTGAGLSNFAIVLSGCTVGPGANTITGTINFTAPTGTGVSTAWIENSALPLTSRANNVFTLLRDQNQTVIANGGSITLTQNGSTTISSQYVSRQGAGVTISPGKVLGSATLTLGYQ